MAGFKNMKQSAGKRVIPDPNVAKALPEGVAVPEANKSMETTDQNVSIATDEGLKNMKCSAGKSVRINPNLVVADNLNVSISDKAPEPEAVQKEEDDDEDFTVGLKNRNLSHAKSLRMDPTTTKAELAKMGE